MKECVKGTLLYVICEEGLQVDIGYERSQGKNVWNQCSKEYDMTQQTFSSHACIFMISAFYLCDVISLKITFGLNI